jgi:predicted ABC-type ATPase
VFLVSSSRAKDVKSLTNNFKIGDNKLFLNAKDVNSYVAAVLADFVREKLLAAGVSFSFETVMSHPSKIETLLRASDLGYRTYLYYIATESPFINSGRVATRVQKGGHNVPDSKLQERYARSLGLLLNAVKVVDRAFLFDNSGQEHRLVAEVTNGTDVKVLMDEPPLWFLRYIVDKSNH